MFLDIFFFIYNHTLHSVLIFNSYSPPPLLDNIRRMDILHFGIENKSQEDFLIKWSYLLVEYFHRFLSSKVEFRFVINTTCPVMSVTYLCSTCRFWWCFCGGLNDLMIVELAAGEYGRKINRSVKSSWIITCTEVMYQCAVKVFRFDFI